MTRLNRLAMFIAVGLVVWVGAGCVTVKPWEREILARDDMAWDEDPRLSALRSHIRFSKEATLPGSSSGGGGCGCN